MITPLKAKLTIDARDAIGDSPRWDAAAKRLLWSDNAAGIVHESKLTVEGGWHESKRWNLDRPIAAAIPRTKGGFVVAGGTEIFMLDEAGNITRFVSLDADPKIVRFSEAKCDPQGRLWAGTLARDFSAGYGSLYRIDPDGAVSRILNNVPLSRGFDWSPDGSTFYYIDSLTLSIDAFDFNAARGSISNRRTIVTVEWGEGLPDGISVDREGCIWVAIVGAGQVRRYAPQGTLLEKIEVSAPAVTSCAFGGLDGGDLFITSAAIRLPEVFLTLGLSAEQIERSHAAPGAGGVFVSRPGTTGMPATAFAG